MLTIVTGGSGSGKSAFAEGLVVQNRNRNRYYIATMKPWDDECIKRIEKHRLMRREKGFETIEHYEDLHMLKLPETGGIVLLECLSNLAADLCFEEPWACLEVEALAAWIVEGIIYLESQAEEIIVVTNELFSDGMNYQEETIRYCRILGRVNCLLAKRADRLAEVVYGIPVWQKGGW